MNHQNFAALITSSLLIVGLAVGCRSNSTLETVLPSLQPAVHANIVSRVFDAENSLALKGFDPVAYFQQGKPIAGNPNFTYQWANVNWRFSTAQNRDLFAKNPEKYAPQYGGFCAWAVSQGYTAPIDPNAWKIVEGKLYLNADLRIQKRWERDIPGNIKKADKNWPGLAQNIRPKNRT
ncbi:YHS domain-containing (seleno)protein [Nodularia spumigena]|uniref:YHS domain-containing (seleno)protein n=1 Tax=Nodularia spumigena TaxID=70799 RepID=UPI002330FF24|nr:YHS domain-containing (seleno)protein [Nodularia spumigena]MDB9316655.1 YHS domain-containing (seleno)protein [Nodularia spumigena CS-590/01A]MDB9325059.1 YHS domain-containing (seleno)protein [Nodularia spumigena CS-590/02]MDB9333874.1 YHS domain-containing (seleno)protein [Nodularia spumigena CS-590/01]